MPGVQQELQKPFRGVVVFSGGLDSTTLLYKTIEEFEGPHHAISFDYGQRHKKEIDFASYTCSQLGVRHDVIDLSRLGILLAASGSSLVSDSEVPEGHYAQENMKSTVVPNRNMIMLSIALGIAVADEAHFVATGVHAGDHFIYPDCRPGFILSAALAGYLGNEGFGKLWRSPIWAPFINKSKADIAYQALELDVPLYFTWSCYNGGASHCGRCGTCVERLEAIDDAINRWNLDHPGDLRRTDPTRYLDSEYWKTVTK